MNAASGASGVKSKQGRVMGPRKLSGPVRPPLAQAPSPAPSRNTHRGSAPADRLAANAIEAGAAGVISKAAQPGEIIEAIRRVHAGESAQPAQEIIALLRLAGQERERIRDVQATLAQLTPREREVLSLLAEGLDNQAIAERLFISPDTARAHVVKVLGKLGVESRLQAAIFAIRHGVGPSP